MSTVIPTTESAPQSPTLQSQDIVAGLGRAPRDLLATCIALFEDSTLQQRLSERIDALATKLSRDDATEREATVATTSLQQRVMHWMSAPVADDELRLVLWMRLREAFDLPALSFGTLRSARAAADDVVAATLEAIRPGTLEAIRRRLGLGAQNKIPDSLDALARQTLGDLLANVIQSNDAATAEAREALVRDVKARVSQLDPAAQQSLLKAIGAKEINDEAIGTILLAGGGLASFGGAVSLSGFSAYILAAQASAFIPLVSGPALVSFVAVLSNPITIVLATAGVGWWAARSANQKIQAAIALRVISLLALSGIAARDVGLRNMTRAFALLPDMRNHGTLNEDVPAKYRADWKQIVAAHRKVATLHPQIAQAMERALPGGIHPDRWHRLLHQDEGIAPDMAAMAALTVGELLYNLHALDPAVLEAADFSRVEDLSDPVAFAAFAHKIDSMGVASHLGAMSNLKGYVAERVVASQLVQQGYVVEFPDMSNEAGWDIAVDGIRFQVKNAADLSLLERHFDHGYEYPVLANAEVADLLAKAAEHGHMPEWADHVHFVEGYSQEAVQHVTEQSVDAGNAMLHPHVPIFAVTTNALRQLYRYSNGTVSGSQAIQEVLVNGAVGAGLAVAGNYAGVAIGLLVFGPAGALVLGSALPVLSRTQIGPVKEGLEVVTRSERYRAWAEDAKGALRGLITVLENGLSDKAQRLKQRASAIEEGPFCEYLLWRLDDDVRFLREAWLKLRVLRDDGTLSVEAAGERLISWLSTCTLHPAIYQAQIEAWLGTLSDKPTIAQNVKDGTVYMVGGVRDFWAGAKHGFKSQKSDEG